MLPLVAASTNVFHGSFHDLPYTPTPLHTSNYVHEHHKLSAAFTRLSYGSTDMRSIYFGIPWKFPPTCMKVNLFPWKLSWKSAEVDLLAWKSRWKSVEVNLLAWKLVAALM